MNPTIHRLLHPRQARARRQVNAIYNRLLTGDTSAITEIPVSCRTQVLDTVWNQVRASAWDALTVNYGPALRELAEANALPSVHDQVRAQEATNARANATIAAYPQETSRA